MAYINIISRKIWGSRFGLGWGTRPVPVKYVILHHSVTQAPPVNAILEQDAAAVRLLDEIGYNRFKSADAGGKRPEGAGISYTWAVPPSGRVFEGHDLKRNSSHTKGYNDTGVGIVLIGNYDNDIVTEQQIDAVARLLLEAKANNWIQTAKIDFNRTDVYPTACPGRNALGAGAKINARVLEIQKGGTTVPVDANKGFTAEYIKEVQTALTTLGYYSGAITGKLPDVDRAVRGFQVDNRLTVDGQPGNTTMGAIQTRLAEHAEKKAAEEKAKAEAEKAAEQNRIADFLKANRVDGRDRWAVSRTMATATFPAGKGIFVAADGTPDERYATARATGDIRYVPVKSGVSTPPTSALEIIREYKPAWIKVIGGEVHVTDDCALALFRAAGLI